MLTAALLTHVSMRPNRSMARVARVSTCDQSLTSVTTASALPPSRSISAASVRSASSLRAAATTEAPFLELAEAVELVQDVARDGLQFLDLFALRHRAPPFDGSWSDQPPVTVHVARLHPRVRRVVRITHEQA